jgi:uncharacterized protein YndB with AHSA1/START domain
VSEASDQELRIERTYEASAEEVFDAWTSAEVLRRWMHAGEDWTTPVAEVDLRVGGAVRIVMRRPGGGDSEMHGEYREIERPHRLVMAWTFADRPDNRQLIELSFSESGGATTVVMVNTDISGEERRESQERGWSACLAELGRVLGG